MSPTNPRAMTAASAVPNNRASYVGFGLTWLLGYGAYALTEGDDPMLGIPAATGPVLLIAGMSTASIITAVVMIRAQRGARGREAVVGYMLAASWLIGFVALYLLITALSAVMDPEQVQTLLWPSGSGLVVGMIYLAGGVAYHDMPQFTLGAWLAVIASAALFFEGANLYWALAVAGGGYLVAAALRPRGTATATVGGGSTNRYITK